MKIKIIVLAFSIFTILSSQKATAQYDSLAVSILDSMSDVISDLESCSFKFNTNYDIQNDDFGLITHSEAGEVFMKGAYKLFIEKRGDKGHKQFFYNGKSFLLYSFDKNQYATMPAEISVIELIDSISSQYSVEFPGADVFYPDFVDNLLATSNNLVFLGLMINEKGESYHIVGSTDDMTYQFWVDPKTFLPDRMTLNYITQKNNPRYTITFTDWNLNPFINDSAFEFVAPAGAQLIKISK